jgi:hypothetical protein
MPEKAQPTILRDIGELLALLRALMLETKHILKMMDHLMNQNRKLDRCFAPPAFRQIDGVCGVIVEGERIALRRYCLIVGGNPSSGRREQCFEAQVLPSALQARTSEQDTHGSSEDRIRSKARLQSPEAKLAARDCGSV